LLQNKLPLKVQEVIPALETTIRYNAYGALLPELAEKTATRCTALYIAR